MHDVPTQREQYEQATASGAAPQPDAEATAQHLPSLAAATMIRQAEDNAALQAEVARLAAAEGLAALCSNIYVLVAADRDLPPALEQQLLEIQTQARAALAPQQSAKEAKP